MSEQLRKRRAFFDTYGSRANEREADLPPGGIRFSCPCCGYPTLGGREGYEICELCWWEDDGQDNSDADLVLGGPNHGYSLKEARLNFGQYLVMYPPAEDRRVGGPDTDEVRELKRGLMRIFDRMCDGPPAAELNELWRQVRRYECALSGGRRTPPG